MTEDSDPRAIVRRGYDLVSYAYRGDTFDYEGSGYSSYLGWIADPVTLTSTVLDVGCGCGIPVARELSRRCRYLGVDVSPVQVERARLLVPEAEFICGDITLQSFEPATFDGIIALYSIIHIPVADHPALLLAFRRWLKPGGFLLATVGAQAWTGTTRNWKGVPGGLMYWSHADADAYRRWFADAGFWIERETFVPEGDGGHQLILAGTSPRPAPAPA